MEEEDKIGNLKKRNLVNTNAHYETRRQESHYHLTAVEGPYRNEHINRIVLIEIEVEH
jgi:hypothetical protein